MEEGDSSPRKGDIHLVRSAFDHGPMRDAAGGMGGQETVSCRMARRSEAGDAILCASESQRGIRTTVGGTTVLGRLLSARVQAGDYKRE